MEASRKKSVANCVRCVYVWIRQGKKKQQGRINFPTKRINVKLYESSPSMLGESVERHTQKRNIFAIPCLVSQAVNVLRKHLVKSLNIANTALENFAVDEQAIK